jgi:putative transferase (TIGR04331 family)
MNQLINIPNSELTAVSKERIEIVNNLSQVFYKIMNEIHGMDASERFWKIILLPYYSAIISSKNELLGESKTAINPPLEVYSNSVFPSKQSRRYGILRYVGKMSKTFLKRKNWLEKIKSKDSIYLGFDKTYGFPEENIFEPIYPVFSFKEINWSLRNIRPKFIGEFPEAFIKSVIKNLPMIYLEYFKYYFDGITVENSSNKIFHVLTFENTYLRFVIAKYILNGSKLYYYQHGGYYGEYPFHNAHYHESDISDKFITWGWKILEKDEPGQALKCGKFKIDYLAKKSAPEFDILLVYPVIENKVKEKIKARSEILLGNLDRNKYKKLCVRPRPTQKLNRTEDFDYLKNEVTNIDHGFQPIVNLISKSRLVLQFTYPSTNMMECFYVNQPCVALLENDSPSEIIKPYYDFFITNGVFHLTMDTLVEHLNKIDLNIWWEEIINNSVYLDFKKQFINETPKSGI